MKPFTFQDHEYKAFALPGKPPRTRYYRQTNGRIVKGTTPEQTIIDSLARPDRCLGVENVLRIISVITSINVSEFLEILECLPVNTRARVGWVFEQKKVEWNIPNEVLVNLKNNVTGGPYYFAPSHQRTDNSYDKHWRLYFPESLQVVKGWING